MPEVEGDTLVERELGAEEASAAGNNLAKAQEFRRRAKNPKPTQDKHHQHPAGKKKEEKGKKEEKRNKYNNDHTKRMNKRNETKFY